MNMQTIIEQLNEKIDAMVARYETIKSENSALQNEVASVKAQSEAKDAQIRKLEEDNALKDIEIEDIVKKIESALS
jgi:cell division protein ZapB